MTEYRDMPLLKRLRGTQQLVRLRLTDIQTAPDRPRQYFEPAAIDDLAESIRRYGLLSPLLVRRLSNSRYELIAGERRLRALKQLNCDSTEALILPDSSQETALLSLIENLHREPLGYFEEAEAYKALMTARNMTQEALAEKLMKSPSALANKLRLLKLPPAVREELQKSGLSERHARALLRLRGEERQLSAARQAAQEHLSVRQTETLISRMLTEPFRAPFVRSVCRDHRLFVNAMMNTVKTLQRTNAAVSSRVVEHEGSVDVIVTIPRLDACQPDEDML